MHEKSGQLYTNSEFPFIHVFEVVLSLVLMLTSSISCDIAAMACGYGPVTRCTNASCEQSVSAAATCVCSDTTFQQLRCINFCNHKVQLSHIFHTTLDCPRTELGDEKLLHVRTPTLEWTYLSTSKIWKQLQCDHLLGRSRINTHLSVMWVRLLIGRCKR